MPFVFACIAPHGDCIVAELEPASVKYVTRQAMLTMGQQLEALHPDTIVLLTPHGIRIDGMMCVSVSERAEGKLSAEGQASSGIAVNFEIDQPLANVIADQAVAAGIPVARAIYGASSGEGCCIPLDWGAVIPLWFMGASYQPKPRVVIICPSRRLSGQQLIDFGNAVGTACEQSTQRIALIASADQAHAHSAAGPYGYDAAAAEYDTLIQTLVRENRLNDLLTIKPALVNAALPDSLWQMLILSGALQIHPMHGELLSYEVADYFGMLCAAYR